MPFTMRGSRLGRRVEVRWDDGALEGDDAVLDAVDDLLEREVEVGLEPVGPWFAAGVEEPWRALLTVRACLDRAEAALELEGLEEAELVAPGAELEVGEVA